MIATLAVILLGWSALAPPVQAQVGGLNSFYGERARDSHGQILHTKEQFVDRMYSRHLKVSREEVVKQFNVFVGPKIGYHARSFDELMQFVQSSNFEVLPCGEIFPDGGFPTVGWNLEHGKRAFTPFTRYCYDHGNEPLLVYRTGVVAFSLWCGNLGNNVVVAFAPPPPPMRAYGMDETCPTLGWECNVHNREIGSGWNLSGQETPQTMLHGAHVGPPIWGGPFFNSW